MSTPTERVREYLRQFDRLRDTGGVVHQVATDPDAPEGIALTSTDLHALLEQAERAATVPLIDTRGGAPITRQDDESPTPVLALPLDLPEGVESPEELGQIFDAPSRQELELYRAHMDDRDVHEDHREDREAGFSEGWTRAYYLITAAEDSRA